MQCLLVIVPVICMGVRIGTLNAVDVGAPYSLKLTLSNLNQ